VLVQEDGTLTGPVAKNLSEAELAARRHVGRPPGRLRLLRGGRAAGRARCWRAARLEIGARCGLIDESRWEFVWVVDAPLFEPAGRER
jgi:aspartyl-tRNA synthetase